MKIVVTGSRDWDDVETVEETLSEFPEGTILIHGNARGLDKIAAAIGEKRGFDVRAFHADWSRHGRAAGPIRNRDMLEQEPYIVLAFPLPDSKGTVNCMNQARDMGICVRVVKPKTREVEIGS